MKKALANISKSLYTLMESFGAPTPSDFIDIRGINSVLIALI